MKVLNNENKLVEVSKEVYSELKKALSDGYWSVIIRDINNDYQVILLQNL